MSETGSAHIENQRMKHNTFSKPILVAGATGYVGGRLVPALLAAGYQVRALARVVGKLQGRPWARDPRVALVAGDVLNPASLKKALDGCSAAYYLVHSMLAQKEKFVAADRQAAANMAHASAAAGLERIIYLGGLAETQRAPLSKHLQSRLEVADILRSGSVPVTELRAPVILGSGSASFEILRYLVDRLPVMITPRWVRSRNQPIAIRDVIAYLVGCLAQEATVGRTFDIGGPDIMTYQDLLNIYAEEAGLPRRLIIPVPVLTPKLSAYWIHLVSPVPAAIALPLAEGLTSNAVCSENHIQDIIPQQLLTCRQAIRLALDRIEQEQVDTCWMDAGSLIAPEWAHCGDAEWAGGTVMKCGYRVRLAATPLDVWQTIRVIGGSTGWYFANFLWRVRGWMDRMVGGVGLRRGRRHPSQLGVGDALDFWRVLELEEPRRLALLAEMKTPGQALLTFQITEPLDGQSELEILSRFMPRGLLGILYWYALYPFHEWVFHGMLKAMAAVIGKPILSGPQRFTPKLPSACERVSTDL